jgi:hypothetical protein
MTLFHQIRQRVDYLSGRYQAFVVEAAADRTACMLILDEVRRSELNRVVGSSPLESGAFAGIEVDDLMLACRDTRTGEIVGCVRSTNAAQLVHVPASRAEYDLDRLPPEQLPRAGIATRLAFRREHRRTVATFVLLETMYEEGLARDYLYCLLSCEPHLYFMYARLGFRPLDRVRTAGRRGLRIPLLMVNHDHDYLRTIRSPLLRSLERTKPPTPTDGVHFMRQLIAKRGPIDPGIAECPELDDEVHHALTDGMSKRGVAELLDNAVLVSCNAGDLLFQERDGGRFLSLVVDGEVEVRCGDTETTVLGRGEPFGVVSTVLETTRIASVVAHSERARVLFLSRSALGKVRTAEDREALWRNLARQATRRAIWSRPQGEARRDRLRIASPTGEG